MPSTCPACGLLLDDAVDCPRAYPPGCGLVAAMAAPGRLDPARPLDRDRRARAFVSEVGLFAGLELLGLLASPLTLGAAGMVTSLLATLYLAVRDLDGGRFHLGARPDGAAVVDAETGAPATNAQALLRNAPLALAWALAILPDPLGLVGWAAVGFLLVVEALVALGRDDGRRLGDLLAGTVVARGDPD